MPDVLVFTALAWERRAVLAGLGRTMARDGARTWVGRLDDGTSLALIETGVGPGPAARAARAAPAARFFLTCGCGGALVPALRTGDVVTADEVITLPAGSEPERLPAAGEALAAGAALHGLVMRVGPVVTSAFPLTTPAEKRAAARTGAIVVDMESAAFAREARARGVAHALVRVVLDRVDEGLVLPADAFDPHTGTLRLRRIVPACGPPWRWSGVARLVRQRRVAARRLREFSRTVLANGAAALGGAPSPRHLTVV